jgi:hypothetical protein
MIHPASESKAVAPSDIPALAAAAGIDIAPERHEATARQLNEMIAFWGFLAVEESFPSDRVSPFDPAWEERS